MVSSYLRASVEEKRSLSLKKQREKAKLLGEKPIKQFLIRSKNKVNKHYIYTNEEIRQEKMTRYLFEKIDSDKSGALDPEEL